jgi:ankyrin repeat protein
MLVQYGHSVLHYAAIIGDVEIATRLLEASTDLDVDAQDVDGDTPLHKATRYLRADMCRLLVDALGAKVDIVDKVRGVCLCAGVGGCCAALYVCGGEWVRRTRVSGDN